MKRAARHTKERQPGALERLTGTCRPLCEVDVTDLVDWIEAIPLSEWPQQDRLSAESPYPAMVSNPAWYGFGEKVAPLVRHIMEFNFPGGEPDHRMLSVVVSGQRVLPHDDIQSETWRARVHVPLVSNPGAIMSYGDEEFHLDVGTAYLVNTEVEHALVNLGAEPRIHFFFDVRSPAPTA